MKPLPVIKLQHYTHVVAMVIEDVTVDMSKGRSKYATVIIAGAKGKATVKCFGDLAEELSSHDMRMKLGVQVRVLRGCG